ncbi:hypothetical protein ADK55_03580 [Streptomyces sp. WM4235]|nr:hypothetical protein ADK55_03580 [Streptomyces sp. WM4235]
MKAVLPETQAGLLVGFRQWPLVAHRMDRIRDHDGTGLLAAHPASARTPPGRTTPPSAAREGGARAGADRPGAGEWSEFRETVPPETARRPATAPAVTAYAPRP